MYAAYLKTFTRVLHASGRLKIDSLGKYKLCRQKKPQDARIGFEKHVVREAPRGESPKLQLVTIVEIRFKLSVVKS
jgi:hypothetical protein